MSFDVRNMMPFVRRLAVIATLGALTAGCFQPMYAQSTTTGGEGLRDKLSAVDIREIKVLPKDARLGVEVRNGLLFNFTGGSSPAAPTHELLVSMSSSRAATIVDPVTSRADVENYGIDVSYVLKEVVTGKVVVTGATFARVSYDIPGQEQRFARARGLRDAETRATKVIADNISQRLASYFVAGT